MEEHEIDALPGKTAQGRDGEDIGKVADVHRNDRTDETLWVSIRTGLLGRGRSYAPLSGATVAGDTVVLPYDKDKVVHAPALEGDWPPSFDDVHGVYQYYATSWMDGQVGGDGSDNVAGVHYSTDAASGIADPRSVQERTGAGKGSDALEGR
jgi:hypothetical protein